ncbi:hypothetical protein [Halalkalibacter lacteus]|uniref:hypothetical protein n=1 Tax=Halalkalibacter lacteus TaxID=3090663 RepID=UPI002FCACC11
MDEKIILIQLNDIQPLYTPYITQTFLTRMISTSNYLQTYDLIIAVEKNEIPGKYTLVGGYDKYKFLKEQGRTYAPCIIEKYSGPVQQHLKVMRRLHNKGDSWSKDNKTKLLAKLKDLPVSFKTILRSTGFKKNYFQDLHYHDDVEDEYKNSYATITTLNWIVQQPFTQLVKEFLYKRACLKKGNPQRLTQEKVKFIDYILKSVRKFNKLTEEEQIKVLKRCMSFKGEFVGIIQNMIDDFLDK